MDGPGRLWMVKAVYGGSRKGWSRDAGDGQGTLGKAHEGYEESRDYRDCQWMVGRLPVRYGGSRNVRDGPGRLWMVHEG
jgi:hypothetical protein